MSMFFYTAFFLFSLLCALPTGAEPDLAACFSPAQNCDALLMAGIEGARKNIRVAVYSFTSDPIAGALVRAADRGVKVRVILDSGQRNTRSAQGQRLLEGGVTVRYDSDHAIQHNKYIITDDNAVLTGSYNFTAAARTRNAENLLLIRDRETAREYIADRARHWAHSSTEAEILAEWE